MLLIVEEKESKDIVSLNKKVLKQLKNAKYKDLVLIPKAGHLFDDEEDSIIEKVAEISREGFTKFL
jgi:alpha/beta superfamily hydrolase